MTAGLDLKGFVATVPKPRNLKITGTDERATIDLFVNGASAREKHHQAYPNSEDHRELHLRTDSIRYHGQW